MDLRTPPLPADYEEPFIPLTPAVGLVTFERDGEIYFGHYDGYDV
jgi:hypothetical protein